MEEIKLPPPERAAKTAIGAGSSGKGTVGSYLKADALFSEKGGTKLDYGSGRGEGAKLIKADTYEPYVKSNPNYDDAKKIPSASYNKVTSLNVLNVLPPEARNEAVKNIGRILTVNGEAIVSTRGVKDVESAKTKVKARDGYIIGKGDDARFQKGFTTQELKNYIQKTLGKGFTVETVKGVGKAAVKIKKLNIPRGFGGVLRQEGTPVINIQEQLLYNPRRKFSQGGDNKMAEDIKDEDLKEAVEAKSDDAIGVADTQLTNLSRQELMNELYRRGRTPEDIMNQTNLTGPELEALVTLGEGKAKGGVAQQMELFSEGGLKDEGGTVDPVSGNDVPPGSTQEEVRDDIPAQLSEGEFVFPADVVRFLGLNFLMELRQKAKAGLKRMEEMGQMGNSDEATLPDDIPFTMEDLDIAEDAQDNVIEANIGTFVPPRFRQSNVYSPTANPYAPTGVVPTIYAPATAKPTDETQGLLGASAQGAPETENRRYVNKDTNQVRFIPFIKGTNQSLYPIPKGFVPQAETVTEPAPKEKTTRVQTAKVKSVDAGDDGDTTTGDLGGARTTIGGVEYAVQYNFDGTVGLQSLDNYKATGQRNFQIATPAVASAIKSQTLGQLTQLGKVAGLQGFAVAELAKKTTGIDIIPSKIDQLIKDGKKATSVLNKVKPASIFDVSRTLDRDITKSTDLSLTSRPDYISSEEFEKTRDFYEKEFGEDITGRGIEGTGITQKELSDIQKSLEDNTVSETGKGATAGGETAPTPSLSGTGADYSTPSAVSSASSFGDEPGDDTDSSPSGDPGGGFGGSSAGDFGFTATGGLMNKKKIIMKKKPKVKKMKRGGLASR